MAASWPLFLQDKLNQAGFDLSPGEVLLRSDVDSGAPKVRSIATRRIDRFTCSINIDISEYEDWDNFYTFTLANGANSFNFNHPFTQVESEFRMFNLKITPLGGTTLTISMTWELLP